MKPYFLSLLMSLCLNQIIAQTTENALPKWAIVANFGHQDAGVDLSFGSLQVIHSVPIRPHVGLGVERTWVNKSKFRLYQDLQLSYFHDSYVEKVYGLTSNVGFEFKLFKGLRVAPRLGVGFNSAKPNDIRYKLEGEKWVPAANNDPSVSRAYFNVGADLSYRFNNRFDVVVGGHYAVVTPFIPNAVGLYLYKGAHLGVRYFL